MLNTLDYAKDLQAAGFTRAQAEAQAQALYKHVSESVATREQLVGVEQRLDAKIDAVEQRLDAKIDAVEQRLDAKIERVRLEMHAIEQRLEAKIDTLRTEFRYVLMITGATLTTVIAIAAKSFL